MPVLPLYVAPFLRGVDGRSDRGWRRFADDPDADVGLRSGPAPTRARNSLASEQRALSVGEIAVINVAESGIEPSRTAPVDHRE